MQRMKTEIEQQKQTDTPTVEEIIDEDAQQNHEKDIHETIVSDTNPLEIGHVDNPAQERESDNLGIQSDIDASNVTPTESSSTSYASSVDSNPLLHIAFNRVLSNEFKQALVSSY